MRTIMTIAPWLLWAGCTCSSPDPIATDKDAAKDDGAAARSDKKAKPKKHEAPVLKEAWFTIPVQPWTDGDGEKLRAIVQAAALSADPEAEPEKDEALSPWKCRRARTFGLVDSGGMSLVLYERFNGTACEGEIERWWLELDVSKPTRPENRDGVGTFDWDVASEHHDWRGDAWEVSYHSVYSIDLGRGTGPFDKDDAWVAAQLPEGIVVADTATTLSERWALARVDVAGEKLTVEADRWSCDAGGKVVGNVLRFRTNRRGAGHTANKPKDVVVINKVDAFADAIVQGLGERLGGPGITTDGVLACNPE